jgi:hypothetical protein
MLHAHFVQSTSASSARIIGSDVMMPCPSSHLASISVTVLSVAIRTHAFSGFAGGRFRCLKGRGARGQVESNYQCGAIFELEDIQTFAGSSLCSPFAMRFRLLVIFGTETKTINTFNTTITVKVVPHSWQTVGSFISSNWQWLWTTLLVPVAGWLFRRYWTKQPDRGKSETQTQSARGKPQPEKAKRKSA